MQRDREALVLDEDTLDRRDERIERSRDALRAGARACQVGVIEALASPFDLEAVQAGDEDDLGGETASQHDVVEPASAHDADRGGRLRADFTRAVRAERPTARRRRDPAGIRRACRRSRTAGAAAAARAPRARGPRCRTDRLAASPRAAERPRCGLGDTGVVWLAWKASTHHPRRDALESLEDVGRPQEHVVTRDDATKGAHAHATLLGRHVDSLRDRPRESVDIVRIDHQCIAQFLRGPGHFAQHEHAVAIVARGDELLRDEVHPVVERADDAEVREAVERDQPANLQRRLAIADRTVVRSGAVPHVDVLDLLVDLPFDLRVAPELRARRHPDLDEREPAAQLRSRRQQAIDGLEALRNPLRVVEAIDADADDRDPRIVEPQRATEPRRLLRERRIRSDGGNAIEIHADGGRDDVRAAPLHPDLPAVDVRRHLVPDAHQEVPPVAFELERQQVVGEQACHYLAAPRAHAKAIGVRPRDVPEERGARAGLRGRAVPPRPGPGGSPG